jgi:hypothetical protein
VVKLTEEERKPLVHLLMRGEEKVGKLMRARALRLSGERDAFIAEAVRIYLQTVRNRHKRFAQEGGKRPWRNGSVRVPYRSRMFGGRGPATSAYSDPPQGRKQW